MSTTTAPRTAVTTTKPSTVKRPSLRGEYEAAVLTLAVKTARIKAYKRNPAKNAVGEPLPMPLRFTIAETTAKRRLAAATAAYVERYGKLPAAK